MRDYVAPESLSREQVADLLELDEAPALVTVPISVSLHSDDLPWAQEVCLRLSSYRDERVRANAVLSFGHLARRFRRLDLARVLPVVENALADSSPEVRGQADAAAEDIELFLGCVVSRPA